MRVNQCVGCSAFSCTDVNHDCYVVPGVNLKPETISVVMVSETAPPSVADDYYAPGNSLFQQTTVQAFKDAGAAVSSVKDIVNRGVYLTTAVKCGKTAYGLKADTIRECSLLLEKELRLFPNTKVLMLMGDVAIKALNYIAQRAGERRVIPPVPLTSSEARNTSSVECVSSRRTCKPARVSSSKRVSEG